MNSISGRLAGIIIALLSAAILSAPTEGKTRQEVTDSLLGRLSIAANAPDSISPLYDLFDISFGEERGRLAKQLYYTAKQAGNTSASLDMLRNIAFMGWREDSILNFTDKELDGMKDSPEVRSTRLYTDMLRVDNMLKDSIENDENRLIEHVRRFSGKANPDPYEQAALLYTVCRYLGRETRGGMLEIYIDSLHTLVESMNLPDGSVRRHIYTRSAPLFFENGSYSKVIETDMRLLHEIDSLETSYAEEGRSYFNAVRMRYGSYCRILGCYPILSNSEIEDYYKKILYLSDLNPDIAGDIEDNEIARIFYSMATKDYKAAVRMLKRQINNPSLSKIKLKMLHMLMQAAKETDDKETLFETSLVLNDEFEKRLNSKRNERTRKLKLVYDLSDMLNRNSRLEESSHQAEIRSRTIAIIISAAAILILLILAGMLYRKDRRNRKLATSLRLSNDSLRRERDEIRATQQKLTELRDKAREEDRRKTEFINNMSHEVKVPLAAISEYSQLITDCIPENQRAYLDRFATIINLNVKHLMRLVNDVLDTDSIENDRMLLEIRPTSINNICRLAIDSVFECGKPDKEGISLVFRPECADNVTISTDGHRVSQVLINLLSNAVRFSDEGTVRLDYNYDAENGQITFSVTDEGRGIPDGQEEVIFERFRRLDHTVHGCGLGLYISRLIAGLLGGTLKVDLSYKAGARFLFTIPTKA